MAFASAGVENAPLGSFTVRIGSNAPSTNPLGNVGARIQASIARLLTPSFIADLQRRIASGFTGGATGTEPGVLGLPEVEPEEKQPMGFLDDIIGAVERLAPIVAPFFIDPVPLPGTIPTQPRIGAGQTGIPNVQLAGLNIPGIDLQLPFTRELVPKVGAMRIGGTVPSLFHDTPAGQRRPNKVTLVADETGRMAFMVDAGRPTAWSKVTLKRSQPRHHHHYGRYRRPY